MDHGSGTVSGILCDDVSRVWVLSDTLAHSVIDLSLYTSPARRQISTLEKENKGNCCSLFLDALIMSHDHGRVSQQSDMTFQRANGYMVRHWHPETWIRPRFAEDSGGVVGDRKMNNIIATFPSFDEARYEFLGDILLQYTHSASMLPRDCVLEDNSPSLFDVPTQRSLSLDLAPFVIRTAIEDLWGGASRARVDAGYGFMEGLRVLVTFTRPARVIPREVLGVMR